MISSWSNATVTFGAINKTRFDHVPTSLNDVSLFPAPDNDSFFSFGGQTNWLTDAPKTAYPVSIDQFSISGDGKGNWSQFDAGRSSGFNKLTRPVNALSATVQDTFFMIGGYAEAHSDPRLASAYDPLWLDGMVVFNMTSGKWTNDTVPSHVVRNGILNSVPGFGPAGLLLGAGMGMVDQELQSFENITIYEPIGQTWHYQTATGEIPSGRDAPCSIGVTGDNGTYEIFMYGGSLDETGGQLLSQQNQTIIDLDQVYVLSLPAFTWFRASYPATNPRSGHTCELVGKRQMLTIGGSDPRGYDSNTGQVAKDPARHGIQIFDLTELQWASQYDANAEAYKSPQVVKDWYQKNEISSVHFDDPDVPKLFAGSMSTGNTTPTNTTASSGHRNINTSNPKPSHTGAIIGGVIGGIAALCLILLLLFLLIRRRRKRHQNTQPDTTTTQTYHQPSSWPAQKGTIELRAHGGQHSELVGEDPKFEMDDERQRREMDALGTQRHEISGGGKVGSGEGGGRWSQRVELDANIHNNQNK
ncbi:MAG: hypothetical protein Q9220_001159 [cf. Caloplaca sp. 1 TL-2023]